MAVGGWSRYQEIDEQIDRLGAGIDAALPTAGGTITGSITVLGNIGAGVLVLIGGSGILSNPATNVVAATGTLQTGGKNSLAAVNFCGREATTGAPGTGTWAVGDAVMDSTGLWWYCTVAGTPGTWVGAV